MTIKDSGVSLLTTKTFFLQREEDNNGNQMLIIQILVLRALPTPFSMDGLTRISVWKLMGWEVHARSESFLNCYLRDSQSTVTQFSYICREGRHSIGKSQRLSPWISTIFPSNKRRVIDLYECFQITEPLKFQNLLKVWGYRFITLCSRWFQNIFPDGLKCLLNSWLEYHLPAR